MAKNPEVGDIYLALLRKLLDEFDRASAAGDEGRKDDVLEKLEHVVLGRESITHRRWRSA